MVLRGGEASGYHSIAAIEGEPHVVRRDLVRSDSVGEIEVASRLACFLHLTDLHVTDVQSPARFEFFNREFADPRFHELLPMQRPQEALNVHAIAAMVRTLNRIEAGPLAGIAPELAIMSGDAVDNVQWNELANFMALLDGGQVHVDSGAERYEGVQAAGWPDDFFWKPDRAEARYGRAFGFPHLPGLLERALKPFAAEGLRTPWLGCRGNHEEVCQGVGIVTPRLAAAMVGPHKPLRLPAGIDPDLALETFVHTPEAFMAGPDLPVTPDPDRRPFSVGELVDMLKGHGFGGESRTRYVHDTQTVRLVVLDTVCAAGGADGCIGEDQMRWLERSLREARDRPVVIVSHHTLDTLDNPRTSPGPRHVARDELLETVHRSGSVVLWLNGHVHANAVRAHPDPNRAGKGFWEVTTSSLVDWPCQARLIEIFAAGDGLLAIACTMIDHDSDEDSLAWLHRELAGNVPLGGFAAGRAGTALDRNAILLVRARF
ncbi:MAG TPA: metallophosphoesterase [Candidatus Dormibacteraeota bacterium]